jgi:predicted GIY-YIG superfamily endonuclease
MKYFYAYMLICADGSYYTGHTDNLEYRLAQHNAGEASEWTCTRRPVKLVWAETYQTRDDAFAAEQRIKGWRREKKEALIQREYAKLPELAKTSKTLRQAQGERVGEENLI